MCNDVQSQVAAPMSLSMEPGIPLALQESAGAPTVVFDGAAVDHQSEDETTVPRSGPSIPAYLSAQSNYVTTLLASPVLGIRQLCLP